MKIINGYMHNLLEAYPQFIENFPHNELKTLNHMKDLMKNFDYKLYILYDCEPIGYSLIYEIKEQKKLLLDYIFIKKNFQNMGYGAKFLKEIIKLYTPLFSGMFLEIEIPTKDNQITIRRLKFYENFGAKKIDCQYIFPNNSGGLSLELMHIPFNKEILTKNIITNSIEQFFKIHYDVKNIQEIYKKIIDTIVI